MKNCHYCPLGADGRYAWSKNKRLLVVERTCNQHLRSPYHTNFWESTFIGVVPSCLVQLANGISGLSLTEMKLSFLAAIPRFLYLSLLVVSNY